MFTAMITTLMAAFSDIFWKKSLSFGVGWKMHDLLTYPVGLALTAYFIFAWMSFETIDIWIIGGILIVLAIDIWKIKLQQDIYRAEKYSIIAPYTNLHKILIIIGSFFIFSDVSITALIIILLAIAVIIGFSIDFKTLKLPRNVVWITFIELCRATTGLLSWWIVLTYSENLYFAIYAIIGALVTSVIVGCLWEFKTIKWVPKMFWLYRYGGWLGWISWFLSLTIIKNLWLSISILLWFLWIGAALFFSYIFMKDVPSKKDILLTIIVTVLVGLWFYFK